MQGAAGGRDELRLQQQYSRLCQELEDVKGTRARLRAENEFLQQEAQQLRAESQAFLCYVAKRAQRRQAAVLSLDEHNRQSLAALGRARQELLARYQRDEAALRQQLLLREGELLQLSREVEGLGEIQALQREQATRLQELQEELAVTRQQHTQQLQETRRRFLLEKAACEQQAQQQLLCLVQQAQGVAAQCAQEHSEQAKCENRELRLELQRLLQRSRALQSHKSRLETQAQQLLRERRCMQDVAGLYHAYRGEK